MHKQARHGRATALAVALILALAWLAAPSPALADKAGRVTPVVRVVREVAPAVVNIATKSRARVPRLRSGDRMLDRFFEEFFQPFEREQQSLGSGVIIDGDKGLIVTNHHVVERASQIMVQLADKRQFSAKVVGSDPKADLALLRIEPKGHLPSARLGNSNDIMIGETMVAIGNPFGFSHTVTTGVVSALNRKVPASETHTLSGLIQTDASINPGNSGGPLLNLDGEVIGINTAILAHAQGIGFAIPVNRLKRVTADLAKHGEVIPIWLGLRLQDITPELANSFGLDRVQGVLVREVLPGGPAAAAGLGRGDVITGMDGRRLNGLADYRARLGETSKGQEVSVALLRRGKGLTKKVKAEVFPLERSMTMAWNRLGFTVRGLTKDDARRHGLRGGGAVVIQKLRPGSDALKIGLRPGDLVSTVGEAPVDSVAEFKRQMAMNRLAEAITVTIRRGPMSQTIVLGR